MKLIKTRSAEATPYPITETLDFVTNVGDIMT
jgi:hypothetical protein